MSTQGKKRNNAALEVSLKPPVDGQQRLSFPTSGNCPPSSNEPITLQHIPQTFFVAHVPWIFYQPGRPTEVYPSNVVSLVLKFLPLNDQRAVGLVNKSAANQSKQSKKHLP